MNVDTYLNLLLLFIYLFFFLFKTNEKNNRTPVALVIFPPHPPVGTLIENVFLNVFGACFATGVNFCIYAVIVALNRSGHSTHFLRSLILCLCLSIISFWCGYIRAKYTRLKALTALAMVIFIQTLVQPITLKEIPTLTLISVLTPILLAAGITFAVNLLVFPVSANDLLR